MEVEFAWNLVSLGPSELSTIERCPYYRGVRKERFDCTDNFVQQKFTLFAYSRFPQIYR